MTEQELKQTISNCWNEVVFTYNDKPSGVTSEVHDYIPTFQVWHGDDFKYYSGADDLMSDKFYRRKSIHDLVSMTKFTIL